MRQKQKNYIKLKKHENNLDIIFFIYRFSNSISQWNCILSTHKLIVISNNNNENKLNTSSFNSSSDMYKFKKSIKS